MPKAWIVLDKQYPVYSVSLEENATCGSAIEVKMTSEQIKLTRQYVRIKELYETMCGKLVFKDKPFLKVKIPQ